jgi:hypothetical protein
MMNHPQRPSRAAFAHRCAALAPRGAAAVLALLAACAQCAAPASAPSAGAVSLTGAPVSPTGAPVAPNGAPGGAASTATEPAPLTAAEAPLLGAWTEGLTAEARAQLAALPPEQAIALRASLGDTLVFRADHTLRIYPRCAQAAQFGRAAIEGLPARWEVVGGRMLRVQGDRNGRPFERSTAFRLHDDQLDFFDTMASKPQVMGRYEGPVPPRCQ